MTRERRLIAHLLSLDMTRSAIVGVFVAHDGEPDLLPLISYLQERGQTIALPVLKDDPNDFSMDFVTWNPGESLRSGRYDIPIPPSNDIVEPDTLLVSLVGFDPNGNRIGRGAGFFDRYLATSHAMVVGVGFEVQRFDAVPVESHDVPLPLIVTDLGVRYTSVCRPNAGVTQP